MVNNDFFFTQHMLTPTRGNAILDLILTTERELVTDVRILHNFIIATMV